ncbi:hypothetical protein NDU88_002405 [Pleurodeles waltl]|uniref:protein-glutamine gamma-glutamyltransferase n=1 Tax=Pleurodeles waltl TaxID=8319 RepID=A0AAV7P6K1_PLEWA|nr:hypothetical protein NDU88_002405 [Pleurodeles waltl]
MAGSSSSFVTVLQVEIIDLHLSSNKKAHHTDSFDSSELILRRGQDFSIGLKLSRDLMPGENMSLITKTGPSPSDSKKTRATIPLSASTHSINSWSVIQKQDYNGDLILTICSPKSAAIGRYSLSIQIKDEAQSHPLEHSLGSFIMLFNPWTPGDDVYMAEDAERVEYVINDLGILFLGTEYQVEAQKWAYGQFDKNILDICLRILDRSINHRRNPAEDVSHRNDPIYICRVLSAMVNSRDDNGVLMDTWSKNSLSGEAPINWKGSAEILHKWWTGGYKTIKYGRSWVFASVLCTVLRCFGIPCRSVTNFNSAQDTDRNLYVDTCYDDEADNADSCSEVLWNFHVWNEVWFARKDLGSSYDGWQAVDASPLEKSGGIYRCGPTSVHAIKEGDVDLDYDTPFMFAAVNADVSIWIVYSDGTKKKVNNNTSKVGNMITTKSIGGSGPVDIKSSYKYPEGSKEERDVFKKATSKLFDGGPVAENSRTLIMTRASEKPSRDPQLSGKFTLTTHPILGQDVKVTLNLSNLTSEAMLVKVHVSSSSVLHHGLRTHVIWKDSKEVPLGPKDGKQLLFLITSGQYRPFLSDEHLLKVVAVCEVEKTDERVVTETFIPLGTSLTTVKAATHVP